jgi:adenylate kinase family enzyme
VPLLGPDDPLPYCPCRVLITGTSGSGKTTLGAVLAATLTVPFLEMDAYFHGPGWTRRPSFEADVHRFAAQPAWVTEWQYRSVQAHLAGRADSLVWLDLPRSRVMRQVIRRTLVRRLRRQELWNGNVEAPLWTIFTDREHIVRWAWNHHAGTSVRVMELLRESPALPIVRLRSRDEVSRWLNGALREAVERRA